MPKTRLLAYAVLLINVIIWGAALPIVKPALEIVTPYQYLFLRHALAAIITAPVLIYLLFKHRPSLKTLATIISLEMLAITFALSFLYEGLARTSSIEATLLANTSTVFITIGAILFLKETEERHELVGLILAVAGMTLLTLGPIVSSPNLNLNLSLGGNLLVLGQNIFWAAYLLLAKKFYQPISKLLIGSISLWVGAVSFFIITLFATPFYFITSQPLQNIFESLSHPSVSLAVIYMAIFGSIIAVPAYIIGNNLIEASEAAMFQYLQPAVAVPLAFFWLKEPFTPTMAIALAITVTGVVIAEKRSSRPPGHNTSTSLNSKKTLFKKLAS